MIQKISILIPVFQECRFIEKCLDSLLTPDTQTLDLEVLVLDGMSPDGTREIVARYTHKNSKVRLVDNPEKFQVSALNRGLSLAQGDLIIRCDAHSEYPLGYIQTLIEWHEKNIADNIGGVCRAVPGGSTVEARAIAFAMSSRLGVGFSHRTISGEAPRFVDTVPFGSWKKSLFAEAGVFDTAFIRAQDLEHNIRLKKIKKKILMLPWLKIQYFARENRAQLFNMFFQYGYWKNKVNRKHHCLSSWRQLVPPLFFLILGLELLFAPIIGSGIWFVFTLSLYAGILAVVSAKRCFSEIGNPELWIQMVASFGVIHGAYAAGYMAGFYDFFIRNKKDIAQTLTVSTR